MTSMTAWPSGALNMGRSFRVSGLFGGVVMRSLLRWLSLRISGTRPLPSVCTPRCSMRLCTLG